MTRIGEGGRSASPWRVTSMDKSFTCGTLIKAEMTAVRIERTKKKNEWMCSFLNSKVSFL